METNPIVLILLCFGHIFASPPQIEFFPSESNIFIDENAPVGTSVQKIVATTDDSSSVTISLANEETRSLVNLTEMVHSGNTWTVEVILIARLDRDRSPNTRSMIYETKDDNSVFVTTTKLIIKDVNDNPPYFTNLPYRITLKEGSELVNKSVFVVSAQDPDDGPGGSVVFAMSAQAQGADETYNKTFQILNEDLGNITLTMELDYETRIYYQYQIFAKDRGNPQCPGPRCLCSSVTEPGVVCAGEPVTFIVTVQDVQDTPPYFERLPYIAQVTENETVGTSFYQVSALDGDRGVPNDVIYSIVDEEKYPFTIDATSGVVKVGDPGLDADQTDGQSYIITIMATEVIRPGETASGVTNASTTLSVTVNDINDNAPQFKQSVYHANVLENTPRGVPLTITPTIEVSDSDQSSNSLFVLTVEKDGVPYEGFQTLPAAGVVVQGMTTVMISVYNSSLLDFETTKNVTFQLRATESSTSEQFSNTTTIVLTIQDMNDNSPTFLADQTTVVNVTEHETSGTVLATFTATDRDSGDYGVVNYSLEDNLGGKFAIDSQSGNLSVEADLDREEVGGAAYSLVVVATDNMAGAEAQRRSTRLNVRVIVLDINDNAPIFQPHPDVVTVQENAANGTVLITLTATDKDEGLNGKVVYRVLTIQPASADTIANPANIIGVKENTGVVFVNSSLIGFPGSFNVTFVAYDSAESPNNATTSMVVNVRDVNINAPVFTTPDQSLVDASLGLVPNITVDEEIALGTVIIQLNATDNDTGVNGLVYYFIDPDLSGFFNYFDLVFSTGNLTNKRRLDREEHDMLQITLKAEDRGTPTKLSTTIPFQVYLRDIDDNPPVFPPPATLSLSAGEEMENVLVGFVNVSTDADFDPQNKIACYYLYGGDQYDIFSLSKLTGELRLDAKLDRDVTPTVELVVKATANCTLLNDHFLSNGINSYNASDSSLLKVVVRVEDINDNPPVFVKDALTVGLVYDKDINTEVINLVTYTQDNDTAIHSRNRYNLTNTRSEGDVAKPPPKPFVVNLNGSVTTNRLFQSDEKGYFVLTVMAFDDDNQFDVADLTIYLVGDRQRVKLVFNRRPNYVQSVKGELVQKLSEALGMTIIADKIASHITANGNANPERTDVFIHGRYIPSGEIVPPADLINEFDFNDRVRQIFQEFGATETLQVWQERDTANDEEIKKAFIIVAIGLGIICIVLILVLMNTIRRYQRRLRAATTSAFVSQKEEPSNYVPPGTNRYFAAENPLFGKDVKGADVDKLGDNDSLDDNAVDGLKATPSDSSKDKVEEQEMYLELFDEGSPQGVHINHLAMVLQEYERDNAGQEEGGGDGGRRGGGGYSSSPYIVSGDGSDKWRSSLNGHVKSDSGFNEHGSHENVHNLQYTDI